MKIFLKAQKSCFQCTKFQKQDEVFREDFAATTTNLEGILNIADTYKVETLDGDKPLIRNYKIDVKNNSLLIDFNADALQRLKSGYPLIEPDASVQE